MQRRVVVTGMGTISPLGNTVEKLWNGLLEGKSGAGPVTRFDTEGFTCKIACELKDFDPDDYLERKEQRRMDLNSQYAMAASQAAIDDSGIDLDSIEPYRCGETSFVTRHHQRKAAGVVAYTCKQQ